MSGRRNVVLLLVCLARILLTGDSVAQDSRPGEVVSGISVTVEEAAPHHLRVEVCGPDATRLQPGFPLVFQLRVPVRGLVVRTGDAGMLVGARAEGQTATVTLTRDPFRPPVPWRVVVLLSVEGNLQEGQLAVGAARYPLPTPLPAGHATVVLGTGCEERYAGHPAGRWLGYTADTLSWSLRLATMPLTGPRSPPPYFLANTHQGNARWAGGGPAMCIRPGVW